MKQIQKFGWHLLPIIISQLTQETSSITFPPDTKENDTKTNTQYGRRWYKHDLCIQISVSDQLRSHLVAKVETNASGVTWCSLCYIYLYEPVLYYSMGQRCIVLALVLTLRWDCVIGTSCLSLAGSPSNTSCLSCSSLQHTSPLDWTTSNVVFF